MKKIPVAILGATGAVGQKFVELLQDHPWFEIAALSASERSVGIPYGELVNAPPALASMPITSCRQKQPASLLFSGLDASVAGEIEAAYASQGYTIISNARNHRMTPGVPLLIPEVNAHHLDFSSKIITNPNCAVVGLAMALKPLVDQWGVSSVHVVTMQAVSGAGSKTPDIEDNIIPFIAGEEEKIETEPQKIFGEDGVPHPMKISAQCHRVPVSDGHLLSVSLTLSKEASSKEIIQAWREMPSLELPSAPHAPITYFDEEDFPQPRRHRGWQKGMGVTIGRLRACPLTHFKFDVLVHNTVRGAAGGALLNAELLYKLM